jgi:uncharacterized protein (DUF2147 family)
MKEHGMSCMAKFNNHSMARPAIALVTLLALAACGEAQESKPATGQLGRWLTESGNLEIEIAPCGQALCGTVVKVVANRSMAEPGKSMASDAPSPLGMKIMTDFTPSGDGEWHGQIFNRENGKTYDCLMSLESTDQLKIRPYVGIPLAGKTQIWRRVVAQSEQ